ncbi:T9SS type A sorting domain-containing protein [Nonlabens sp. Ci31]|jgi:hypothetical protein|uniref:T9SS type A sorting domain-containing protein n=1 Tax=Nonlabens sp. Ci31 TaxID=2608253 RepID=UPI00146460E6|nr:T9SS type A sorting domain-containing protein [Nonlabens sp. Ci31]QJP34047.1 T9SS type A sorting domain-containing protein [Nonlabens sp. Ci31]
MRTLLIIFCLAFAKAGSSQTTLSHQVIGSLGSTETSGNIVIEQSLGDLVIVSSNVGDDFAAGFQQGRKYIDYIYENTSWRPNAPESNATFIDNFFIRTSGPVLGSDINIKDITLEGSYTLDLGTNNLFFKGDLSSLNSEIENGTLHFVGDDNESNSLENNVIKVDNFVKDGVDEFVLNQELQVQNLFTLKDGNLNAQDGNLLFTSTSSNTAEMAPYESGTMTGVARVQRYIPAKRAFRFLASSVNTTGSIFENWQENGAAINGIGTHITGSTSGANGFDATGSGNVSMFNYNNSLQSWTAISNTDVDGLEIGKAYRVMIRGDRTTDLTSNTAAPSNTVLQAKGNLDLNSYIDNSLSQVAGEFNFVANPYQATVNMNTVLQGSTNVNDNFYYVWDPTLNSRGAYVTVMLPAGSNIAGSDSNEFIQPGQSVFVSTLNNSAPMTPTVIEFNQDDIVNGNQTLTFSTPSLNFNIIGRLLSNSNRQPNVLLDAWGIFMDAQYSNTVDQFDALTLGNLDETISIVNGSNLLNIEHRNIPNNLDIIPLNHNNYRHTSYNYQFVIEAIPPATEVYLKDNFLNSSQRLNEGNNDYLFTIDPNTIASSDPERFHLFFTNTILSEDTEELLTGFQFYPNPVNDVLNISWSNFDNNDKDALTYKLINTLGQIISVGKLDFVGNDATIKDLDKLATGSYYIELNHNGAAKTVKIIKE